MLEGELDLARSLGPADGQMVTAELAAASGKSDAQIKNIVIQLEKERQKAEQSAKKLKRVEDDKEHLKK